MQCNPRVLYIMILSAHCFAIAHQTYTNECKDTHSMRERGNSLTIAFSQHPHSHLVFFRSK